jgi:Fe-S oxidoreductase
MLDRSVTREVFEGLGPTGEAVFYILTAIATAIFVAGLALKLRKYLRGRGEDRFGSLSNFLRLASGGVMATAMSRTVGKRDRYAGVFHAAIMWGFIVLFIGTAILTIDTDIIGIFAPEYHFFWGPFYVVYSLVLDVLGLAMVVGLGAMAWRRLRFRRRELDYGRVDIGPATSDRSGYAAGDWIFLGWLLLLGLTGFVVEGVRIVASGYPWFEVFSPVGMVLARVFGTLGLSATVASDLHLGLWWFHAIIALGFVAYIPYAKAIHMLADGANVALRSPLAGKRLPVLPAATYPPPALTALAAPVATDGHVGLRDLADFSWKQLLDLDACTKCGRCHAACPAVASGAPLSPRDLILDLRQQADATWAVLAPGHERRSDLAYGATNGHDGNGHRKPTDAVDLVPADRDQRIDRAMTIADYTFGPRPVTSGGQVAGGLISAETLWSCTTCLACVEACPVAIEHVPTIVGMRRSLVDQGLVESGLQTAFTSLAKQGNSFGQSGRARARWTDGLATPIRDARQEPVDWLWFVGDFASFDLRVQEATRLVARVFQAAGLDFGILFEGERNAGNDVRRAGEEGLFEMLVEHNVGQLAAARFRRIVTTDPHTLNTLRHEYPQFGAEYEVWHYSQLLSALFHDGHLVTRRPIGRWVTYHDPCYLARYAEVTAAPREVLGAIGTWLVEMPRNGANTFCCGAGGGRIWMDDSGLSERPSEQRIREAAALGKATDFVTACPKDLTMYTAAAKATGFDGDLVVRDLVELVAAAIDLPGIEATLALAAGAPAPVPATAGVGS